MADDAITSAFRDERAAVLVTLIRHVGDFELAEAAVQDAFATAVAHIPYAVPVDDELPDRLRGVLKVVYLIFNEGYSARRQELGDEALRLGRLLCTLAELQPSPVIELNRATAVAFADGPEAGLRLLEPLLDDLDVHYEHSDHFFVLEGEVTVRLGLEDEPLAVPAGSLARVQPGVVHGFRNASDADMRYLNFHAPGCDFITYMRGLRDGVKVVYDQHDPPEDGGRPISEATVTSGDVLVDVDAIRVERVTGVTEPRTFHALASYWVLEGELKLTVGAEEVWAPAGSWVQIPPGHLHAVDGAVLSVTAPSSTA